MAKTPREKLSQLLLGSDQTTSHSASVTLPADRLVLSIEGIGRVGLPINAPQAKKLVAAARPAHFGKGEETLLDASVRDTWEITPDQVTLSGDHWEPALTAALEELSGQLGIPENARLRPELHSMLVYGKGQFFAAHQDSEKHDDMVATLVLSLPSTHTGGDLVIDDNGAQKVYKGSRHDLVLVAFYADRRHEVKLVRTGTRVTLTFNLLLEAASEQGPRGPLDQAKALIRAHFTTPTQLYTWDTPTLPGRLVLLLDHEYSQRSLTAKRLKGQDAERVALLTAAAEATDCEWALAQCEIQETRDAVYSGGYRGRYEYFDDDKDDMEAGDLIDDSTALTWWADAEAGGEIQLSVEEREICVVTPSAQLTPYASEYEGFMGNYGNTFDRWYRRGALVIWPTETGFATRAAANLDWALGQALGAVEVGDTQRARSQTRAITQEWGTGSGAELATALRLAHGVDDPDLALDVLAPFTLATFSTNDAPSLAELARRYPAAWWPELRRRWEARYPMPH
ncbi:MAG: 2OG-Fe(II) oxygenase [Tessaracoccus sp.]